MLAYEEGTSGNNRRSVRPNIDISDAGAAFDLKAPWYERHDGAAHADCLSLHNFRGRKVRGRGSGSRGDNYFTNVRPGTDVHRGRIRKYIKISKTLAAFNLKTAFLKCDDLA